MQPKITLIGAGSVIFAKQLICDVLQAPELGDATICLMDIDPKRLKVADVMARRLVAKLRSRVKIESTLNQRKAVQGARYVICTIQVGGYKPGTEIDFEIPKKYGLRQTIADTLGVGGVFRGLRTIPVINKIARDIAEVGAPDCILLNYTNPMAMNCLGVSRAVGIPHVGLCHSVQGTSQQLAGFLGLPYKDVSYLVAGINHMAFFLKFEYKGQDAYPLLFKLIEDPKFQSEKVRFEMMRRTGYFVTESSEHQSEYVPYFIHHGEKIVEQFDIPLDEYIRRCESILSTWKNEEKQLLGGDDGDIDVRPLSHEYGSFIIRARETNKPVVIYGNVPNTGLITNLPQGCCVELPCLVDAQGIQPTCIGDLPPQLAAICRTNINVQELTVEAALTGKREHIYHAVMTDPHTASQLTLDKIWAMCDDLIEAHQKAGLLCKFAPTLKNTGRSYAGTGDRVVAKLCAENATLPKSWNDLNLTLEFENLANTAQEVAVAIVANANGFKQRTVRAKLNAGKKVSQKIILSGGTLPADMLEIDVLPQTPNVFGKGLSLGLRTTIEIPSDGEAVVPVTLAGFPAGEVRLSAQKKGLRVKARLLDSNIKTDKKDKCSISVSVLELFFASSAGRNRVQLFVAPQPGESSPSLVRAGGLKFEGATTRQSIDKTSYTLDLLLPYKQIGLPDAPNEFLFDFITTISDLGDAHSGGRTSMNGRSFDSWLSSDHYAWIVLKSSTL